MRIDHVAHTSRDPHETHRFYSEILGLKLAQAYAGKDLMLVYALPDGGSLVFSASHDAAPDTPQDVSWQRRHVGLTLSTRAEFEQWLKRLKEHGVRHQLVEDERIYFADPDGLVLELEVASEMTVNPVASEVLLRWQQQKRNG